MDVKPILGSSLARARREALCWGGLWSTIAAAKLIARGTPPASLALVCALVTSWALVGGALVGLVSGALDCASERWRVLASMALGGACCLYFLDASGLLPLLQGRQGHRRMLLVALGFVVGAALFSQPKASRREQHGRHQRHHCLGVQISQPSSPTVRWFFAMILRWFARSRG
jgi:hypothetical protein